MAALPLSQTVDASQSERSWRSSVFALMTSAVVQGLVITALIVTPLLVAQAMPEPVDKLTLPPFVPAEVVPPVERAPEPPRDARPPTTATAPELDVTSFVPTVDIPEELPERDSYFAEGDPVGVIGGVPPSLGGAPLPREPEPEDDTEPEPVVIVGNVQPPRKVVHVNPVYPPLARAAQVQGTVKLQAVIDVEGRVSNLEVVRSIALLDRAAIDAVQQWRYEPTFLNGRAVPVIMTVAVEFKLR